MNDGLAKGWKHTEGVKGSLAPRSGTAHGALAKIIRDSRSLAEFKRNMREWSEEFINGGFKNLPPGFHKKEIKKWR